jgi:hypothetical protein
MTESLNSEQKVAAQEIAKLLLSTTPAGTFLSAFIDFQGKIKQKRINQFISGLQNFFDQSVPGQKFHFDLMSEEDFTDIFEGVLKRVAQTQSLAKHQRFKNIIINQIQGEIATEMTETFLELTLRLHDKQIAILRDLNQLITAIVGSELLGLNNTLQVQLKEEERLMQEKQPNHYTEMKEKHDRFFEKRNGSYYQMTDPEYAFFIQDLSSKSLVVDSGIGGIGINPFELVEITTFGRKYLQFIRDI